MADKSPRDDQRDAQRRWSAEIKAAERHCKDWMNRGQKVVDRYLDEKTTDFGQQTRSRFNILWSNVQTLRPALYARAPVPEVVRRHKDRDPVGLAAAIILERCIAFLVQDTAFDECMKATVEDYLLPGRGTAWVRYIPHFGEEVIPRIGVTREIVGVDETGAPQFRMSDEDGAEIEDMDAVQSDETGLFITGEPYRPVIREDVEADHVFWKDFLHSVAPCWANVRWVAKRASLSRAQLVERFGEELGSKIPLNAKDRDNDPADELDKERFGKAEIWEIWDKPSRKAIWLCLEYTDSLLDERDDPLKLEKFFPCPRPLFATHGTDSLIPVPDFIYYQDQARQLDEITLRIDLLTQALRVVGTYDQSQGSLQRILQDADENTMIPVDNWAAFAEKGGLQGSVSFMPIQEIANVVSNLVQIREQVKQDLYEITGISDIVRGQTQAAETATAQRLKGQFATLRLRDRQDEVSRFARDIIALMGEIVAEQFSPETMLEISGYANLPAANAQVAMEAIQLLKDEKMRTFRVEIETDSTIQADEQADKEARVEFLQAAGGFMNQALPLIQAQPAMGRLVGEMLMFGVRGFKAGRSLEAVFEETIQNMEQQPAAEQGPSPEERKLQLEVQKAQAQLQLKQAELQMDQQRMGMEIQMDQQRTAADIERDTVKAQAEIGIEQMKAQAGVAIDREKANADIAIRAQKAAQDSALRQQRGFDPLRGY